ncbi:MAG: YopX family protein [Treponema sp.]|nr:YopX family protein [Treponema sp.]
MSSEEQVIERFKETHTREEKARWLDHINSIPSVEYRGKEIKTGDWFYGFLFFWEEKGSGRMIFEIIPFNTEGVYIRVDPETVSKFTGLYDNTTWGELTEGKKEKWLKTGKTQDEWKGEKIYSGDIVREIYNPKKKALVYWGVWELGQRGYGFYCWIAEEKAIGCHKDQFIAQDYQVVGNVYDDPELIVK